MSNQSESTTSQSTLKSELFGPPRRNRKAQYSVVAFGLLMVATVVVPVTTATEALPGPTLVAAGFMVWLGFSELLDPDQRRFVIGLRFAGSTVVMLGFVLQLIRQLNG